MFCFVLLLLFFFIIFLLRARNSSSYVCLCSKCGELVQNTGDGIKFYFSLLIMFNTSAFHKQNVLSIKCSNW